MFSDKQTLGYIIALSLVGRGTRRLTGKNGNASRLGNPLLARRLVVRHNSLRLGLGVQDHLAVIPYCCSHIFDIQLVAPPLLLIGWGVLRSRELSIPVRIAAVMPMVVVMVTVLVSVSSRASIPIALMSQRERVERHFPRLSLVSSPVRVGPTARPTARSRMGEGSIRPSIPVFSIPVVFLVGICRFGIPFLHRKCLSVWNDFPPKAVHRVESSGHLNGMVGYGKMNENNGKTRSKSHSRDCRLGQEGQHRNRHSFVLFFANFCIARMETKDSSSVK